MCRPLTVTCLRRIAGIDLCDHYLTFSDLKIPCTKPDTPECRDGTAPLVDFQNPPTLCAGRVDGLYLDPQERDKRCKEALEKYGRSLHRVNLEGTGKVSSWLQWWRGEKNGEKDEASKSQDVDEEF